MIIGAEKIATVDVNGNKVDVFASDLASLNNQIASISQASTPGTGTNTTVFTFKDAQGNPIVGSRALLMFLSSASGAGSAAITSITSPDGPEGFQLLTGQTAFYTTTALGVLTLTLSGTALTRFITFVLPSGKLLTSGPLVIN